MLQPSVVLGWMIALTMTGLSVLHAAEAAAVKLTGDGVVTLVDGTTTECQILFKHPAAPLLILRSKAGSTVQSLPMAIVHSVQVGGKTETASARRALTAEEKQELERNRLWGDEVSDGQLGRYASTKWEQRPLIVWATPGQSGDALEAGSWLDETGKPLAETPWVTSTSERGKKEGSFDGDILLPAADKSYKALQAGNRDHLGTYTLRHLTVERNASYEVRYTVLGNMWLKDGAELGSGTQTGGMGSGELNKDTFARFCNYHDLPEPKWPYAADISHWVWINTGKGSLEVIGQSGGPSDRLSLFEGTLIVSKDSYIGNGNRGSYYCQEGTTTILLDGARIGCAMPLTSGSGGNLMGTYGFAGLVMFGTPEKPLTKDLYFGSAYYPTDKITSEARPSQRTHGASLVLGPTGRMVVHSVDPTKARVIFGPRGKDMPVSQYAVPKDLWKHTVRRGKTYYPPKGELWEDSRIPNGIVAMFHGQTDFNGVVFDGFYEGGIHVSPEARKQWKNVSFGEQNHAANDKLFTELN